MLEPIPVRMGRLYRQALSRSRGSMDVTTRLANSKGFTLPELMIASAIIGLIAVLAAPVFSNQFSSYRLHGATRKIAWELMAARVQAISQNQNISVAFPSDHEVVIGGKTTDIQASYYGATLAASSSFTFSSKGTSSNASTITVSNSGKTKDITVTVVGKVKINP